MRGLDDLKVKNLFISIFTSINYRQGEETVDR